MLPSQREFIAQTGFLTFAHNTSTTDYFELATMQAASIKHYMPSMPVAVVVDSATAASIKSHKHFDQVIVLERDLRNDHGIFANEMQAFALTPFKETIKLESDLVLTRDIRHWIPGFRHHDILLPNKIVNFRNEVVVDNTYRNFFRINNLPNVYTGIYYFRFSTAAANFFKTVVDLFLNWQQHKNCWRSSPDDASTDVVFAIAARLFGEEHCTNPSLSYPTMVHMKGAINDMVPDADWTEHLYSQLGDKSLTAGFYRQIYPFHYYQKHWRIPYD